MVFRALLIVAIALAGNAYAQDTATSTPAAATEPYLNQQWPPGRVLVWANPGAGGSLSRAQASPSMFRELKKIIN